jgi:cytochrome c oxidase assembly factor CtaG
MRARRRQIAYFVGGLAVLWLALDWPIGALASGYLLSAAALQYLLVTLAAAPLLLLALPRGGNDDRAQPRARSRFWRPPLPLLAGAAFALVLFGGSVPGVLDLLRSNAGGSMALALAWLGAALALWWPLLRGRPPLGYMAGVAYLFVPFLLPKIPGLVYIVAAHPVYETYADASRVAGLSLSAAADQRAAGAMLWSAGTALVFVSLGVLFFLWYRDERRVSAPGSLQLPADPEVVDALFAIPGAWTALERVIAGLDGALAERSGTELRFSLRERRVVLEVHALLDRASAAAIEEGIARDLEHYLARQRPEARAAIESRLAIEVVPINARIS